MGHRNLFNKKTKMIFLETPRLILRSWKDSDLKIFQQMNNDPIAMEFFLKRLSFEESELFMNRIKLEFKERSYGLYAVELKESNEFIGFTGFHFTDIDTDFSPCVEISWRYVPKAWGYGYATEAAKACIEYAKRELGFNEIYSFTYILNRRSENVMKKLGMKRVGNFQHPLVPDEHKLKEHVLYKLEL